MSDQYVSVPRELLEKIEKSWRVPDGCPKAVWDGVNIIIRTGLEELRALLAAPAEDVRAVVDGALTDEGTMLQVLEPQQQKLLPLAFVQPHPPRHEGFLQPDREVPGYTLEQMKEYGAACVAEFVRLKK